MKFRNVSRYFDTIDTFDGYTGRYLWRSQPGSFESSSPEGSVAKRRVLSVAPGIEMPERRCIKLLGETWIVGDSSQDGLLNQVLRQSYWMRKGTALYSLMTPGQGVLNVGGTQAYGLREYLKDTVNVQTDAEYDPQYDISFTRNEVVLKGMIVRASGEIYHVRTVRRDLADFKVATSDDLTGADVTAVFEAGDYDPISDTVISTPLSVPALMFEFTKLYELRTQADAQYLAGDRVMLVAKSSVTPKIGQQVEAAGELWSVMTSTPYQDAWLLHLRSA